MTRARLAAWIDAGCSTLFVLLGLWGIHAANEAAADAVRRYGHNVDSGAIVYFAVVVYVAPVAVLLALASCALFLQWSIRWYAHWIAVACAMAPVLFGALQFIN
jgi:hypothetical protein